MPQPKSLSTVADFKQTLSLLLCECVATIGEFLKFEICSKADETEEGGLILNWTVSCSGTSDSIRVILDDSKHGKPVATLTSINCDLLESIDLEPEPEAAMKKMRPYLLKCLIKIKTED